MGSETSYKWSILIPSLPARRSLRERVLGILEPQIAKYNDIELLVLEDNRSRKYGPKLQAMIDIAQGEYLNFIDDDDIISHNYVDLIYPLLDGVDCVGMTGEVSIDDGPWKKVFYTKETKVWSEDAAGYHRNPQHLTPIKSEIVRQVPWVGHYGADQDWSTRLTKSNLIQTENFVDDVIYSYFAYTDKNRDGVWR